VFRGLFSCNDVKCVDVRYVTRERVALEESKDTRESYRDERTVKTMKNRELRIARSVSEIRDLVLRHCSLVERNKVFLLVLLSI